MLRLCWSPDDTRIASGKRLLFSVRFGKRLFCRQERLSQLEKNRLFLRGFWNICVFFSSHYIVSRSIFFSPYSCDDLLLASDCFGSRLDWRPRKISSLDCRRVVRRPPGKTWLEWGRVPFSDSVHVSSFVFIFKLPLFFLTSETGPRRCELVSWRLQNCCLWIRYLPPDRTIPTNLNPFVPFSPTNDPPDCRHFREFLFHIFFVAWSDSVIILKGEDRSLTRVETVSAPFFYFTTGVLALSYVGVVDSFRSQFFCWTGVTVMQWFLDFVPAASSCIAVVEEFYSNFFPFDFWRKHKDGQSFCVCWAPDSSRFAVGMLFVVVVPDCLLGARRHFFDAKWNFFAVYCRVKLAIWRGSVTNHNTVFQIHLLLEAVMIFFSKFVLRFASLGKKGESQNDFFSGGTWGTISIFDSTTKLLLVNSSSSFQRVYPSSTFTFRLSFDTFSKGCFFCMRWSKCGKIAAGAKSFYQ